MVVRIHIAPSVRVLVALLEGLVAANEERISALGLPGLYRAGVRYRREAPDRWVTAEVVARRGYGDCEDLAAYRAAELRLQGENAKAVAYRATQRMWHVVVERGDGTIEDPSRLLGMRGRA